MMAVKWSTFGEGFFADEYLTIKCPALTDVFGTNRAFLREYGSGFLTRGEEVPMSPVTICLKSISFALARRSHKGYNFGASQSSM